MATSGEDNLFTKQMIPDFEREVLLFTFLITILKNSEHEHEQIFIYRIFLEGSSFAIDAFPIVFVFIF